MTASATGVTAPAAISETGVKEDQPDRGSRTRECRIETCCRPACRGDQWHYSILPVDCRVRTVPTGRRYAGNTGTKTDLAGEAAEMSWALVPSDRFDRGRRGGHATWTMAGVHLRRPGGRLGVIVVGVGLLALTLSGCGNGSGGPATTTSSKPASTSTSAPRVPSSTSTSQASTTAPPSTVAQTLTATAKASPSPGLVGGAVTFSVTVRGPGVMSGEGVEFGDGATSGANAGEVPCGQTPSFDLTTSYTHAYSAPGTYQFRDSVNSIGPPPACRPEQADATVIVAVTAPLHNPTMLSGAFSSPSRNIFCNIEPSAPAPVRCATFSPPQLATMDATGRVTVCRGGQCGLGNPAPNSPVLPYGSATETGPYQCVSQMVGMTCTVNGGGFLISRAGIQVLSIG